jgi:pre-mRNA-processing factor 40
LQELIAGGDIKARSKWKYVYPKFSSDIRYLDMLGKPGSNPIELFWDVVDDLDQKLDAKIATVDAAIKRYNSKRSSDAEGSSPWSVQPGTTEVEFLKVVQENGDEESASLSADDLKQIFTTVFLRSTRSSHSLLISEIQLHEQILKQQADEKRRAERRARHMQDDLRYAIKKLPDPLDFSLGYEEVCVSCRHTQCILTEL